MGNISPGLWLACLGCMLLFACYQRGESNTHVGQGLGLGEPPGAGEGGRAKGDTLPCLDQSTMEGLLVCLGEDWRFFSS